AAVADGDTVVTLQLKAKSSIPDNYIAYVAVDKVTGFLLDSTEVDAQGMYIGIKTPIVKEPEESSEEPYPDNTPAELDSKYIHVAKDKPYTATATDYRTDGFGDGEFGVNQKLTDGIFAANGGTNDIGAYKGTADNATAEIIIDLEGVYSLKRFAYDLWFGNWGIPEASTVEYLISTDGENFTSVGTISVPDKTAYLVEGEGWKYFDFVLTLDEDVEAQYVKVVANGKSWIWGSEIRVYGIDKNAYITGNIAYQKAYTLKGLYMTNGVANWPDTDNKEATDGKIGDKSFSNAAYFGLNVGASDMAEGDWSNVIVDLDGFFKLSEVKAAVAANMGAGAGITAPKSVKYSYSLDGENWTEIGIGVYESDVETQDCIINSLAVEGDVVAKYIKYEFEHNTNWAFISEVLAYGEETDEPIIDESEEPSEDDTSRPSDTSDIGMIAFAILALITAAGIVVVKKVR
ncbi:discoidin domain-containing protein, partial [Eubacteriales bacterium OttesenSCG-928-G02]|nr:discoidin domain-containing protein [Eubacteriales bacterium OttesenSCG-928-G02]